MVVAGRQLDHQIACIAPFRYSALGERKRHLAAAIIPILLVKSLPDFDFRGRTLHGYHFVLRGTSGEVGVSRWQRRVRGAGCGCWRRLCVCGLRRECGVRSRRWIGCRGRRRRRLCICGLRRECGVRRRRWIGCRRRHGLCVCRLRRERGVRRRRRIGCRRRHGLCKCRLRRERGVRRRRRIGCLGRGRCVGRIRRWRIQIDSGPLVADRWMLRSR